MQRTEPRAEVACAHCGDEVPDALRDPVAERQFCCAGCETVYALLTAHGLDAYYGLTQGAGQRAKTTGKNYTELDDPSFLDDHTRAAPGGLREVDLYLEGVHCGACVWLVEKLPRVLAGVREARLELRRSLVRLSWDPTRVSLSKIAATLEGLGYPPHPYRDSELERRRREEDRAFLVRLAVAGALAGNVVLISFALHGGVLSGMEPRFQALFRWLALGLTLPAILGPGRTFLTGAWSAIRTRTPHIDLPVGVALAVGTLWGAWNTINATGEVYFDTVCVLVFLLLVGRWLQHRQRRRAADATELLASLAPSAARLLRGDRVEEVPLEVLAAGDLIEVRAGDTIPCDGRVHQGTSQIDASLLTGESKPGDVSEGDPVHAGNVNLSTRLLVRVERIGAETRVGQLLARVDELSTRKAPIVARADRIAGVFVAVVLVLAAATLGIWLLLDPSQAVDRAVALLIVTCPCALGLATPLAISAALGRAARGGVLIKGGEVLQRLADGSGRVWLDKTGTLTEGRLALVEWTGDEALRPLVLGLEASATHPIAACLREAWSDAIPTPLDGPAERVGGGVRGPVGGQALLVGSPACAQAAGIELPSWAREAVAKATRDALTPTLVCRDDAVVGLLAFGDPLREDSAQALERLRERGWQVGILSGDHPDVVAAVGRALGLPSEDVHGALLPEDKERHLRAAATAGELQVMVGDGVNDTSALAAADAGIAVRGGCEAALTAADVYLARGGLTTLADLFDLAAATFRTIRVNLAISLAYNVIAAGLAMAGLINPLVAAVLMPISSLCVIANSYRGAESTSWR